MFIISWCYIKKIFHAVAPFRSMMLESLAVQIPSKSELTDFKLSQSYLIILGLRMLKILEKMTLKVYFNEYDTYIHTYIYIRTCLNVFKIFCRNYTQKKKIKIKTCNIYSCSFVMYVINNITTFLNKHMKNILITSSSTPHWKCIFKITFFFFKFLI